MTRKPRSSARICVTVDRDTHDKLVLIARRKGLSISAIVRSQLVEWLRDWKPPNPGTSKQDPF